MISRAPAGHSTIQMPHSVHFVSSTTGFRSSIVIACDGHFSSHVPQPTHFFGSR